MKSVISTVTLLLVAAPAFAGSEIPVPEPGGIGAVVGVIGALIALKALRK
jgi:hypothetical protein